MTDKKWQVEYLRITVFPIDNTNILASELWDQYIGEEPDAVNIQKGKLDTRAVEYKNGRIVLIKQPDRIEWRYLAKPNEDEELQFPILSDLEQELPVIKDFAHEWLKSSNNLQLKRMAFGTVLLKPVESLVNGYEYLREYLPFINPNNLSEFDYRINRHRKSKVIDDLLINRLTRWSVASLNQVNFSIKDEGVQLKPANPAYATRLELDINTPANRDNALPVDELVRLFDELLEMGLELTEEGDIE